MIALAIIILCIFQGMINADDLFSEGFSTPPDDLPGGANNADHPNIPFSTDTNRYSDGFTSTAAYDSTSPHFPEYTTPTALVDDRYLRYTNYVDSCAEQGIAPIGSGDQVREEARLKITSQPGYEDFPKPFKTFIVYSAIKWNPSDFAIQEGEEYTITVHDTLYDLTPTGKPSHTPTLIPSPNPSVSYSPTNTDAPTSSFAPSPGPTTLHPTKNPSHSPTLKPSALPTVRPTTPTVNPTFLGVSRSPTSSPSEVPIDFEGQYWNDGGIRVDANGYSSYFDSVSNCFVGLGRCRPHLKKARRLPQANWMSLACSIGEFVRPLVEIQPGFESTYQWMPLDEAALQPTIFNVGKSVRFRAVYSGQLICFANDAHTLYWNNYGQLQVQVTRESWPPTKNTTYEDFLIPSCDSAFIVYQQQQFNLNLTQTRPVCNERGGGAGWKQEDIDAVGVVFGTGAPESIFADMTAEERASV